MSESKQHSFQAEIQQLLDIVIHSLYTDKEIFIRELISNASDALDKLRYQQSAGQEIHQPELELKISIQLDEKANTLTLTDTGIGMTEAEMVENLGTIAHSGSKAFLAQLAEGKKADTNLIGQFGVGFYSAFMVADQVRVFSRSSRPEVDGVCWTSKGSGTYEIEPAADLPRGTRVVVHLKEDAKEFAKEFTVEQIIRRYSNFVAFPIELGDKKINTVQALWTRNKSEIKEEEYKEFYQFVGHAHDEPRYRLHFTADAPLSIRSLLFVPHSNFEKLGMSRLEPGVNLHCRKVLIQAHSKDLLPDWLRFLKGVVDSEDLPLNISRETMQDSALMKKLGQVITNRFLKHLEENSRKDADKYNEFFAEFGRFLKEGIVTDYTHKEALGKLLRCESSTTDKGRVTSLEEYVSRMRDDQQEIYYMLAPTREVLESSPYFEVFKSRNLEVLFMNDPWDEFVMEHLAEYDGKKLVSGEKADLKVEQPEIETGSRDEADSKKLTAEEGIDLTSWLKSTLGGEIEEVNISARLVDSPVILVDKDQLTSGMRQILKQMNPDAPAGKYELQVNPKHPIVVRLNHARKENPALAKQVAEQMLDNARAAAGLLDDPRTMVKRLNSLLEQVLAPKE